MLIRPTNLCFNRRPDKAFTPHPPICTDAGCAYAYPAYKSCFNRRPDKAFTPHPAIVHRCRMRLCLSGLQICALTVGRIRRSRRIRQYAPMPDALTLIRPTNLCLNRRPDKAFTPHPAIVHRCRMRLRLSGLQICALTVGRIRRSRRIRQLCTGAGFLHQRPHNLQLQLIRHFVIRQHMQPRRKQPCVARQQRA